MISANSTLIDQYCFPSLIARCSIDYFTNSKIVFENCVKIQVVLAHSLSIANESVTSLFRNLGNPFHLMLNRYIDIDIYVICYNI
jgi:hypothetical protein